MKRQLGLIVAAVLGGGVVTWVGQHLDRARADVPPDDARLFYSGVLFDDAGAVAGERTIVVRFFDHALEGDQLCAAPAQLTNVVQGVFRVNVSDCGGALAGAAQAFVEVQVDDQVLPRHGEARPPVGAVPYAVQAATSARALEVTGDVQASQLSGDLPATRVSSNKTTVQDRLDDLAAHQVPTGTIIAFAGETAPAGWMVCDGAPLARASFPALFQAIGTAWGAPSGTTFNLPDLRGEFLRGVDLDTEPNHDPDRDARLASRPGGNIGANVGSVQADELRVHSHGMRSGAGASQFPALTQTGENNFPNNPTMPAGGTETRPRNVAVLYIIKT